MAFLIVLAVGLVAGTLGGIVGFGSSIMLMPMLVIVFGPLQAVPIMAIAALLANLSRIAVWWREIDWRAGAAYAIPGIPAAALGARTLVELPTRTIELAIGAFFIAMIFVRRWMAARNLRFKAWHLALSGLAIGYITGIVVSTGPVTAPIFLAAGLSKGAFVGTEAAASLAVYLSKATTFRALGMLPVDVVVMGLLTGSSLMVGSVIARRFVLKMEAEQFRLMMDGLMLASGLALLWAAAR